MPVRTLAALLLMILVAGCSPAVAPKAPADPCAGLALTEKEAVDWLSQRAVGVEDLSVLKGALQGVHTVALGEATHGAHEIFTVKGEVVKYLVRDLGFTVLAMEASYPAAHVVDEYLRTGQGDPGAALAGLGWWITNTEEVLELLRWLRAHNESAPAERQVRFAGFDSQLAESGAAWLAERVASPADQEMLKALAAGKHPAEATERLAWLKRLEALAAGLKEPREAQTARVLAQFVDADLLSSNFREAVEKRERFIAENVRTLRAIYGPESRMIVWGGGSHFVDEAPRAGRHLRREYGDAYYALNVQFGRGGFNAVRGESGLGAAEIGPVEDVAGLERLLACAKPGAFVVDLRSGTKPSGVEGWLGTARAVRYIGARYSLPEQGPVVLRARPGAQDGLIYLPVITPSRLRP